MEILGQEWWIQATGLTISLTGLYFLITGVRARLNEYRPMVEAMREAMLQSKDRSNSR